MKALRTYGTWLLLLTMLCIAAPRTLLHDCNMAFHPQSALDHHAGEASVDHAPCSICDFSATSGIKSVSPVVHLVREAYAEQTSRFLLSLTISETRAVSLRGPPAHAIA